MQNKGFVRVFAILLTLVCVFYLSFSFVTRHYAHKAKDCLLYTSPSPRDVEESRMPSSA